jgi:hypothetical protein
MNRSPRTLIPVLLLTALLAAPATAPAAADEQEAGGKLRWLKIRVYEDGSKTPNVAVNLPVRVVELVLRLASATGAVDAAVDSVNAEMAKETGGRVRIKGLDLEALWKELERMGGQIVEINDGGDRVSIYIE